MSLLLIENNFDTKTVLEEAESGGKNWFIEGIFMMAEVLNRNGRIYPMQIMEKEISRYDQEFVQRRRALGELQHPNTPEIDLYKASHIIESIRTDGHNFIGKARIIKENPAGAIVAGLLANNVQLGVSSRGMGAVVEKNGANVVQPNFKLAAVDVVYSPSAPEAYVNGLMEGSAWVWDSWNMTDEERQLLEHSKKEIQKTPQSRLNESQVQQFRKLLNHLSNPKVIK